MAAGLGALRLFRGALRRLDSALTRWTDSPPEPERQPVPADGAMFEAFFRALPADAAAGEYTDVHLPRLTRTMTLAPEPSGVQRALELGAYMQMTPALGLLRGYPEVRGAYFGQAGQTARKTVSVPGGEFTCDIDLFDAERDRFPYPDAYFSLVLCCEMLEHLLRDPMYMMIEIRRVLEPGGRLLLTTPNCASITSLAYLLEGRANPQIYSRYSRAHPEDTPHVREYTAYEVGQLMTAAGFEVEQLFTERIVTCEEASWVRDLLIRNHLDHSMRGEQTYCVAAMREKLPVDRYPWWLYA